MNEVDELFDELGYEKKHDNRRHIVYKKLFAKIEFNIVFKEINVDSCINMQELQAINMKCKELGWLE